MADEVPDKDFLTSLARFLEECTGPDELQVEDGGSNLLPEDFMAAGSPLSEHSRSAKRSTTRRKRLSEEERELRAKLTSQKRQLKYRRKLKDEKKELQDEEKKLVMKILKLQQPKQPPQIYLEDTGGASGWRKFTMKQIQRRLAAEARNRQLRSAVIEGEKRVSELGEMIKQRVGQLEATDVVSMQENDFRFNAEEIVLFEEYLQEMDVLYAKTDEAFSSTDIDNIPQTSYGPIKEFSDSDLERFENTNVVFIPGAFDRTSVTMWEAFTRIHRQGGRLQYNGVTDPANVVAVRYRIAYPSHSPNPMNMTNYYVVRRYVDDDRVVLVWKSLIEGEGEYIGLHADETGWCVLRSANETSDGIPQTKMQVYLQFVPINIGGGVAVGDQQHKKTFMKQVIESDEEEGLEITRLMEDLLLDDSLDKTDRVQYG